MCIYIYMRMEMKPNIMTNDVPVVLPVLEQHCLKLGRLLGDKLIVGSEMSES